MLDCKKAGRQIALLRKKKGLTQEDVAARLCISPQAVSKWENGHTMPELSLLVELAQLPEIKGRSVVVLVRLLLLLLLF